MRVWSRIGTGRKLMDYAIFTLPDASCMQGMGRLNNVQLNFVVDAHLWSHGGH